MRLIHLGDLHLGKFVLEVSMLEEQRENVQLIDRLLGVRQRMGRGNHRVPEQFTLYQY